LFYSTRTFGPQPGGRQLSALCRDWHRHARWLASLGWTSRIIVVLFEIAIAY
jgi:hypothetical protein